MKTVLLWCFLSSITIASVKGTDDLLKDFNEEYNILQKEVGEEFLVQIGFSPVTYKEKKCPKTPFDYIVIGGSGAGSVLANRLSDNPNRRVLLIEGGEAADFLVHVPALTPIWANTNLNWGIHTNVKQDNIGLGLEDNVLDWVVCSGIGGATLIDYLEVDRGCPTDYNRLWEKGLKGWSYPEVLPYFKKLETANVESRTEDRGTNGPIVVENLKTKSKGGEIFLQAAVGRGYKKGNRNNDCRGRVSFIEKRTRNGLRETTEKSYLRPVRHRKNLVILPKSLGFKILVKGSPQRAYGVKILNRMKSTVCTVKAKREIIVSAGVFGSPQVLLHSGIGPCKELKKFGIPCVKDLQVGKTFYDHLAFLSLIYKVNQSITFTPEELFDPKQLKVLVKEGSGPLSSIDGFEAMLFYKTPLTRRDAPNPPDTMIAFSSSSLNSHQLIYKKATNLDAKVYKLLTGSLGKDDSTFMLTPVLLLSDSKGHLKVNSKNPFKPLEIHGNFLMDQRDVDRLIFALREAQKIASSNLFQAVGATPIKIHIKACKNLLFDSDDYWKCVMKHITIVNNEAVGTCRMGVESDPGAVVDERLRVKGIRGLRVVDTSVIPNPLSAVGNLPLIMLAEKGAHMILIDNP